MDLRQWAERNISHKVPADQPQSEGIQETHSSHDSMSDTSLQRFERQMYRRGRQSARRHPSFQSQESQRGTRGKEKTVARAPLLRVQELSDSDLDIRESDDDIGSSSHGSDDQGGTGGQKIIVYETATG